MRTPTVPAILALADGSIFKGVSIGAPGATVGEVVFNTAMTGYQEILTDPSYCRQIVALTYPHVGNVGVNADDGESSSLQLAGLVLREVPRAPSSWRSQQGLQAYMQAQGFVGIAKVDTRRLTHLLRESGAQGGCIMAGAVDTEAAVEQARQFGGLQNLDLAKVVSCTQSYAWDRGPWALAPNAESRPDTSAGPHVVVYDFGVKRNILRLLAGAGCRVTVVPAQTDAAQVLALKPDGVMLSNGPGDPEPCSYAITAARVFLDRRLPLFGICLGHQILGLAAGARTLKMKFGHHGANHPVLELSTGRVLITSQNHGFSVDEASLPANVEATHRSLFDGTLQGLRIKDRPAFGFQGHPEASPGPQDVAPLFQQFVELMSASANLNGSES